MNSYSCYVSISCALIAIALVLILLSIPYLTNKVRNKIVINRVYFFDKIPAYFFVKIETNDALVAGNPVDITVTTTNIDRTRIRSIQLTFDGANRYFPNFTKLSPPESSEQLEEYFKELEKELDKMREEIGANILILHNDTERIWTSFSGTIRNVVYGAGGTFDIGITLTEATGKVIGYEMGDRNFAIKNAVNVSPPEVLFQLENSNVMRGLAYIGTAIPFIIAGLEALMEIFKRYVFA